MATPGGPRPSNFPPNFNPDALANNMQNLKINQQRPSNPGVNSVPSRPSNASPFTQGSPSFTDNQPRPPPQGSFPRGPPPPNAMSQTTFPPNVAPSRPAGTRPVSQPPPPFAPRPPPPGPFPPSIGGSAAPPHFRTDPRPGTISSYPSQMGARDPVDYGPPAITPGMPQGGPRFHPSMGSMPRPSAGPPPSQPLVSSGTPSQPPQMHPSFGSPPAGAPASMGPQAPPFYAPPQAPPFSASLQNRPPPMGSPFSAPVQGMPQYSVPPTFGNIAGKHSYNVSE